MREIVFDILRACGPWDRVAFLKAVISQTGFRKDIDYSYYVPHFIALYEQKYGKVEWYGDNEDDEQGEDLVGSEAALAIIDNLVKRLSAADNHRVDDSVQMNEIVWPALRSFRDIRKKAGERIFDSGEYEFKSVLGVSGPGEWVFGSAACAKDLQIGDRFILDYGPRGGGLSGAYEVRNKGSEGSQHYVDAVKA